MSGCHGNGAQEEDKTLSRGAGGERIGAGTHGRASGGEGGSTQEEEFGKAQSYAGKVARRRLETSPGHELSIEGRYNSNVGGQIFNRASISGHRATARPSSERPERRGRQSDISTGGEARAA